MGCAPSVAHVGGVCQEFALVDDSDLKRPKIEGSRRSVADVLKEVDELEPREVSTLTDQKMFDSRSFRQSTSRPLSLLALMAVLPSAEIIGEGMEHLPSLLGTLARCVRKQGRGAQARALNVVQFLYAELQEGGALHAVRESHPVHVLAAGLCALLSSETDALDITRRDKQRRLSNNPAASALRVDDRRSSTTTCSVTRSLSLSNILQSSQYFQCLGDDRRVTMMAVLYELRRMGDPKAIKTVLESEGVMQYADKDTQVLFLAQITLLVGFHSHVLRKFKTHLEWCAEAIVEKQGEVVSPADYNIEFAFLPGEETSERFALCHAWVLQFILKPLFHLWARVSADADNPERLCATLTRTINSYTIFRQPTTVVDVELRHHKASSDFPSLLRKCHTSSEVIGIDDDDDDDRAADKDTVLAELPCPLIRNNVHEVELPYDSAGVMSICTMYNIKSYSMLVCRRYDNGLSARSGLDMFF